jgi:hypothetical protein
MNPEKEEGSVHARIIPIKCEDVVAGVDSYMAACGTGTLTFCEKDVEFRSLVYYW